jgi:hypothetical protein
MHGSEIASLDPGNCNMNHLGGVRTTSWRRSHV